MLPNIINNSNKSEAKNTKPDTDYELNWLSYKEAIKYDKIKKCNYYFSLISSKQLIIFTFCSYSDYILELSKNLLFLSFALHYTTNALFFNETNMHQIYEDKGKFNFRYQLPFVLYSAIISTVTLRLILQILVLTDKDVLKSKATINQPSGCKFEKTKIKMHQN